MQERSYQIVPTKTAFVALNPILFQGELYLVEDTVNNRRELWSGLDGRIEGNIIVGTRFNSLPAKCLLNPPSSPGGSLPLESSNVIFMFWNPVTSNYEATSEQVRIFTGPFDPANYDTLTDNDFWFQSIELNPPSSLSASIVSVNTIRSTWVDNSSDEDGFKVERSQSYLDWDLDIADGATIAIGDRIMVSGTLYTCTTGHTLATPRVFNSQNFSITAISYTTITTTAANATTYDIVGNEYGKRYTIRVSTVKGSVTSYNNPTVTAKTEALSGGGDSQTDQILAISGLWAFHKMYDAAAPLADASGNSRTMSLVGAATFQQAALETTDTDDYSILVQQGGNGFKRDGALWSFKTASWEIGGIFMLPNPWGVPGNAPFFGLYTQGSANGRIRLWTDSTSTKWQIQLLTASGSWLGATSTATFAKDIPYFVSLKYDYAAKRFTLYVDGISVLTSDRDLEALGFNCDGFGWGYDGGANLNLRMQKCYVVAGNFLSDQVRLNIVNAGTYIA